MDDHQKTPGDHQRPPEERTAAAPPAYRKTYEYVD